MLWSLVVTVASMEASSDSSSWIQHCGDPFDSIFSFLRVKSELCSDFHVILAISIHEASSSKVSYTQKERHVTLLYCLAETAELFAFILVQN